MARHLKLANPHDSEFALAAVMERSDLIIAAEAGLYCPLGDFYIDPWQGVPHAVVTHSHGDHATPGSDRYLTAKAGGLPLRARLGPGPPIDVLPYGEPLRIRDVLVSFHPAGHVLGSTQVRIEHRGDVWVASGDYKATPDATCDPMEPVACSTFVTESTFGLPIYRWRPDTVVFEAINDWWRSNAAENRPSLVFAYALGKAQRLLAGVDASIGPILCHGAVEKWNTVYRSAGVSLPPTEVPRQRAGRDRWAKALIVAPPIARATPWQRKFGPAATAFASGWMQIRGARRRRSVDRGFVLSDHADWSGLLGSIEATGASRVLATHGSTGPLVRYLREMGYRADPISTRYEGEQDERAEEEESSDEPAQAAGGLRTSFGDNGTGAAP